MIDLEATFEKYGEEYSKFDRVADKLNERPDLCAFLLLDKLLPDPGRDMVSASGHDECYLDLDCEKLEQVATEEDILTLVRCGVRYDGSTDSLMVLA